MEYPPIEVPAGNDYVVKLHELPSDVNAIVNLLTNEGCPASCWLEIAQAYLASGDPELCESVLLKLTQAEETRDNPIPGLHAAKVRAKCFRVQMRLDEYAHGSNQETTYLKSLETSANVYLSQAEADHPNDVLVMVCRAQYLQISAKNPLAAKATLQRAKSAKNFGKRSVAPDVALAQLHMSLGEYRHALAQYTDALGTAHTAPCANEIRMGIGACYAKLGELQSARLAFERVLALDPASAQAVMGLVSVELMEGGPSSLPRCLELLQQAHKLDPHMPQANAMLAQFALAMGHVQQALQFAKLAVDLATDLHTRAYAHCMLARALHAAGGSEEMATEEYRLSIEAQESPLAHYGMAQMLIWKNQLVNAVTAVDKSLRVRKNDVDALLLMGRLLPHTSTNQAKLDVLKEGARHHATNAEVQEMLGDAMAVLEPGQSLAAFRAAVQLRREQPGGPEARLLNNVGVMEFRSKQLDAALALIREAASLMESGATGGLPDDCACTLQYNIARCQEAQGDFQAARLGYEAVLRERPDCVDCLIRLGYMKYVCGHKAQAEELFNMCLDIPGGKEDGLAVLCMVKQRAENWSEAKKHAHSILECATTDESRSYGHVLLGNTYFLSAPSRKPGQKGHEADHIKSRFEHLTAAARHFSKALALQKGNIYAANGLGAVLATLGKLDAARSVFSQLRESAALTSGFVEVPDVWVNLGSMHLARNEPDEAARMYSAALSRFYSNKDSKVLLWLARAYYDLKDIKNSKSALLRAVHLFPHVQSLLFNLALTMQQAAALVLKKKMTSAKATLAELQNAKLELKQAINIFIKLCKLPTKLLKLWNLKPENLKSHVEFCKKAVKDADGQIKLAEENLAIRQRLIDEQEQVTKIMSEADDVRRQMAVEVERSQMEQKQRDLLEFEERWKSRNEEWKSRMAMEAAAKKGDSSKAAKVREKQKAAEAEAALMREAEMAAGLEEEESDDEDYDEAAMAADARAAEAEEKQLREAGYDSQDERGTADLGLLGEGSPDKKKKKKKKKRKLEKAEAIEEDAEQPDDGLLDDAEPPEKRPRAAVLESDDE